MLDETLDSSLYHIWQDGIRDYLKFREDAICPYEDEEKREAWFDGFDYCKSTIAVD